MRYRGMVKFITGNWGSSSIAFAISRRSRRAARRTHLPTLPALTACDCSLWLSPPGKPLTLDVLILSFVYLRFRRDFLSADVAHVLAHSAGNSGANDRCRRNCVRDGPLQIVLPGVQGRIPRQRAAAGDGCERPRRQCDRENAHAVAQPRSPLHQPTL